MNRNQLKERANLERKYLYECLKMVYGTSARKHVYSWGEFAITFLKHYTVKLVEN